MDQEDNEQYPGDDAYIIEDTTGSVEELEREMRETAQEAVAEESSDGGTTPTTDPALRVENQQLKDRYLRTLADFENFRKRNEREKADFFKHALGAVLRDRSEERRVGKE